MIFGYTFPAKDDMTLGANGIWILFLLIDLEIQSAAVICRSRDVTSVGATTRPDRNLHSFRIERIERRHVMTAQAIQVRVLAAFMTKRAGRNSPAPPREDDPVRNPHVSSQLWIEIDFQARLCRQEFMANIAVLWHRRNSGICIVTSEADRMTVWDGFECAFLQPKTVAQIFRRLRHVFFTGIALRLIRLVTDGTALLWFVLFLFLERHRHEPTAGISSRPRRVKADDIDVLVMRETYTEFRNELSSLLRRIANVAETGKQPAARITRTVCDMAVRTNQGRGSFTRKKLRAMAIQTRSMLGKISYIRKRRVACTYFLRILRGNLMTGAACQLLIYDVSLMRELRVIDARFFWRRDLFLRATTL